MLTPRIRTAIVVPAAVLAFAVVGCGSSSSTSSAPSTSASAAPPSNSGSGGSQALTLSADPSGALKFDTSSLSAKAGKVTIQMSNPSSAGVEHGISIEGNGVDQEGTTAQPGGMATVSATLKPGTYTFYCPVDSHKQQGMTGTLTVG